MDYQNHPANVIGCLLIVAGLFAITKSIIIGAIIIIIGIICIASVFRKIDDDYNHR